MDATGGDRGRRRQGAGELVVNSIDTDGVKDGSISVSGHHRVEGICSDHRVGRRGEDGRFHGTVQA